MLQQLTIRNYAIIDRLDIRFGKGMNIITGETGAGKSILMGALGLILGERADTKVLYNENDKCVVEAIFELHGNHWQSFFTEQELDFDAHTIIRREISQSGKSRAFINDTPVTLQTLKQLGEQLVNLHNQHETLELTESGFQLNVVDLLAGHAQALQDYQKAFRQYRQLQKKYDALLQQNKAAQAEMDYLQFQYNELKEAGLQEGEQEKLEAEQKTLSHIEDIKRALQAALGGLQEGEYNALQQLAEIGTALKPIRHLNPEAEAAYERLLACSEELKDIARELQNLDDKAQLDPERLDEVNQRLNILFRLQKKHQVSDTESLIALQQNIGNRLAGIDHSSREAELLEQEINQLLAALLKQATALHAAREKVLRDFQNKVTVLLTKVGMPSATFVVDIRKRPAEQLQETGLTDIRFLFTANKGFEPRDIKDVASGGELSRLMLCIKSLVAGATTLPTMIFDEIDAGISGEVALKTGEIMKQLARNHQLITITHLPQIARTADKHLYIYKETTDGRTYTRIKTLEGDERITEVAKMLSGNKISEAALANARELINS